MKEFLKTNTVTYNLISFTAFKSMLIFSFLTEGPKTYEDIQNYLKNHEFLHESVSFDTIRVYMNTLKSLGCKITINKKNRKSYYQIDSHPFEIKISDQQLNKIIKVYQSLGNSIDIEDYMALQSFFEKFSKYITNDKLKQKIACISPLKNISHSLIKDLIKYCNDKSQITVLYNSANSGEKNIDILSDKLKIERNKLYLYGFNKEHQNYSSFLVANIKKIVSINIKNPEIEPKNYIVRYELKNTKDFEIADYETVISQNDNKITVEISSKDKFSTIQRILSFADDCKVIYPQDFKTEIVSCLNKMKEGYLE